MPEGILRWTDISHPVTIYHPELRKITSENIIKVGSELKKTVSD